MRELFVREAAIGTVLAMPASFPASPNGQKPVDGGMRAYTGRADSFAQRITAAFAYAMCCERNVPFLSETYK
jgi:hypothetical protein